ncbi:hypothetical protein BGZ93_007301 [Podila epicladia]|nr:hypothetical protein BGZ92_007041 [Podila epicladia]KAG0094371.1 hypothetical protein BGZ93_007301 [Podila epicladia]
MAKLLKTNATLTTLTLEINLVGYKGAQVLSEALKTDSTLTTLKLRSYSIGDSGTQELSEVLKTHSTLSSVVFNRIAPQFQSGQSRVGLECLGQCLRPFVSNLVALQLQSRGAQGQHETENSDLESNSIGDNGAQKLAEALKTNSTLTILTLGYSSIGNNGAHALSEILKTNSTLITLNLRNNAIEIQRSSGTV